MKLDKAPGLDNILLEFFTHDDPELKNCLVLLLLKIRDTKTLSDDFHDTNIITIFNKGDQKNCNNYHRISL